MSARIDAHRKHIAECNNECAGCGSCSNLTRCEKCGTRYCEDCMGGEDTCEECRS